MEKYSKKQAACAQTIETLGGDYALKWDDDTQISVNAHAALLSQFAKAGGFFDRRAISAFLFNVTSASQLSIEERRQRIMAHAFREYGTIRRLFPPDIGEQMTMPLT